MKARDRSRMFALMEKLERHTAGLGPALRAAERRWLERKAKHGLRDALRERGLRRVQSRPPRPTPTEEP